MHAGSLHSKKHNLDSYLYGAHTHTHTPNRSKSASTHLPIVGFADNNKKKELEMEDIKKFSIV